MHNKATGDSGGGAIFVDVIFSNIIKCTFKDKTATKYGNDIYYTNTGEKLASSTDKPLLIEFCEFERTLKEPKIDLIHISWKASCDFSFNFNNIILPRLNESSRINLFSLNGDDSKLGTMTGRNNTISPSKLYVADKNSYILDRLGDSFITTPNQAPPEVPEGCPNPPNEYEDLSYGNPGMKGINIYGCQLEIKDQLQIEECCLYLHSCSFNKLESSMKGGCIYLSIDSNTPEFESNICNCTFSNNKGSEGGSIYISSQESSRFLNISNCTFKNNFAESDGGAIYFYSTFCTISQSLFINNHANTKGCEIYFHVFEYEDTEYPFIIRNNKFEHSYDTEPEPKPSTTTPKSLIYLQWKRESDFYFNDNEIRITSTSKDIFLFDSNGDITTGNLSCLDNCLTPSNEYLCDKSNNQPLYERIKSGFSTFCDPQITPPEIKDNDTCTLENHCETINNESIYIHVNVTRTEFNGFYHDDNGGAIHMINTGLTVVDGTFTNCNSTNGGGGGIFVYNELEIPNRIDLKNLNFNSCKAAFGGAIYIYSLCTEMSITIESCFFEGNSVFDNKENTNGLYGGSAIYLTNAGSSEVFYCKFKKNRGNGGTCKISNNLNEKPKNNNRFSRLLQEGQNVASYQHLLIKSCNFDVENDSECSIYFVQGVEKQFKSSEIKDCVFTGILAKNAHHIDGESKENEKPNLIVESCKFATNEKGAINNKFVKIDSKKQVFNYGNDKFVKKTSFMMWLYIAFAAAICIAVCAALITKKRKESMIQTYDITLITDDIENDQ